METTYQTLLDNAPEYVEAVAHLASWSANYDHGRKPFQLFLDMIGYSQDELGDHLFNHDTDAFSSALGYMELNDLADALKEYAARPTDVLAWVTELINSETEEEEAN